MNQENTHRKKWVRITEIENIPLREGRAVQIAGHDIAIFNLGDRFLAVENRCPHRGGPLADGIVSGSAVVCPLHAWKVDLVSGEVLNREDARCVKTFPTRVDRGIVSLEIVVECATAQAASNCFAQVSRGQFPNRTVSGEV
jgi:nitrite reductase (NADH) small subunit